MPTIREPSSTRKAAPGSKGCGLVRESQTAGPLVMDAVLAAIALEHGATVCTTDRDFARGLRWANPLLADR